ncbi:MAG: GxxExxY protein [Candidatus Hydrogenedentes bacterium]|nr:GxxExxY protein [Candidatus Hydrogenedentota bacterium]
MLLHKMESDSITSLGDQVLEAAQAVHHRFGPGKPKLTYVDALCRELELREIPFEREVWMAEELHGLPLNVGYAVDIVVDGKIVVDVMAARRITRDDEGRLLALLSLSGLHFGYCVNFHARQFEAGVRRLIKN